MAALDPIGDLIKPGEPARIQEVIDVVRECTVAFDELDKKTKVIQFVPKISNNDLRELLSLLREVPVLHKKASDTNSALAGAMGEYKKMLDATAQAQTKLNLSETEAAKEYAAAKVALEERNRQMKTEAQLLDEAYQARQRATEAQRQASIQDQIDANKRREAMLSRDEEFKQLRDFARERERLAETGARNATSDVERQKFYDEAAAAREAQRSLSEWQAELKKAQVEEAAHARQLEYMSSSYNRLNAEHSKLYKAARDVGAEMGIESAEFKKAAAQANELDARLKGIDEALGNHRRSVGQYGKVWDGLGMSMQGILREMPSLAVSMNTFLLGISNNILPFLDEVKNVIAAQKEAKAAADAAAASAARLAETEAIAAGYTNAEAKAQGKLAAARSLAAQQGNIGLSIGQRLIQSFLSINTLLTIGVTVLTVFGGKLIEWISNAGGAEKATKAFNKALEESAQSTAEEIGKLVKLQDVLQNTNTKRDDMLASMEEIKRMYPGYFEFLNEETRLTKQASDAIAFQIDLLMRKADQAAGMSAINAATKEIVLAQQELNKEMGFFEKFWAARPWGAKPFEELSEGAKKAIEEQWKLYELGILSKDQYNVMYRRITDLYEAREKLTEATKLALDPEQKLIDGVNKQIAEQQRLIQHYKDVVQKWGPQMSGAAQQEINDRLQIVESLEKQRAGYEKTRKEREKLDRPPKPTKTAAEIELQEAETRAKAAKDGSKDELAAMNDAARAKYKVAVEALQKENAEKWRLRGQDLANDKQYNRDIAKLQAELADELEKNNKKNAKQNKPKRTRVSDNTNRDLSIDTSMMELDKDFYAQQVNTQMAGNKAIADNEQKSLTERLDAYDRYIQNKIDLSRAESGQELLEATLSLEKIEDIEKKSADKRTDQERDLLAKKEYFNKKVELMISQQAFAEQEILAESAKGRAAIAENDAKNQVKKLQEQIDLIKATWKKWAGEELRLLNERYEKGNMSSKEYARARQKIEYDAREGEYKELQAWIQKTRELIQNSDLPDEVKKFMETIFNQFPSTKAVPEKPKSLLEMLGFGEKDFESAKAELARQIESLYSSMFSTADTLRNNYYQGLFDQLDAQKNVIEENAEKEKKLIEDSVISQVEKEKKLKELEEQRQIRERQIDNAKRALQRRQAMREKQDAIFQASLNAGIAISKVFAGMGTGPQAAAVAIATAALIAAQTAANIATIASRPIPEYWQGTGPGGHTGGPAIVGERGTELGILPSGHKFLTPSVPTLYNDLPKGTEIIPHDVLVKEANQATRQDLSNYRVTPEGEITTLMLEAFDKKMDVHTRRLENAIKNKKELHIKIRGHADFKEHGPGGWVEYVGNMI